MKKPPKPQRARRGTKYIGNFFIKDTEGVQINLGTKNATLALERAREFAKTGKRNFQDDLDAAAERTVAAVEGAAAATIPAEPITQPAAAQPPPPPVAAPAPAPAPESTALAPAATPEQQQPPPPAADWREDARAAASEAAAEADAEEPSGPDTTVKIDPNVLEAMYTTGAEFLHEMQLWMQAKVVEWKTGTKPPPLAKFMARPGLPEPMVKGYATTRELSIACMKSCIKRKFPIDNIPDWAGAMILTAGLAPLQLVAAKVEEEEAKRRKAAGGDPPEAPRAPAPAATDDPSGATAEAL